MLRNRVVLLLLLWSVLGPAFNLDAASVKRSCVAINQIENKAFAESAFFQTMLERLQNAIVNTGKFDVVDNTRLEAIALELEKEEKGLTGESLQANLSIATTSVHGAILSMTKTSKKVTIYDQIYTQTRVSIEMIIRFQDLRNGIITQSKQVNPDDVMVAQESRTIRNTSRSKKITCVIEPEKTLKDPKSGRIYTIPAKTESVYFSPEEEELYNKVMQKAVNEVVELLMEFSFPLKVVAASNGKVYINLPEERAKLGDQYEILKPGEALIDPDTGLNLGPAEERIMLVKIATIRPKFAIGVPVTPSEVTRVKKGMIARKLAPNTSSAHNPEGTKPVPEPNQKPARRPLIRN